jgi:phosphomannomutase
MYNTSCFKTYDIRGRVGDNLDTPLAFRIGRAYARVMAPHTVVLGRDARDSSPELRDALAEGLAVEGVNVFDIDLCGTEEVYFATDHLCAGGGMMVTASHNPIGDNGIKLVGPNARPISRANGLDRIEELTASADFGDVADRPGILRRVDVRAAYAERVLSFVDTSRLATFNVVVNAGNGAAGPTFDVLATKLAAAGARIGLVRVNHEPDSTFPNGIPNPLLPENRPATADVVRAAGADIGIAWDGDFDRCFLFDENGDFVDGEYIVGLLAAATLARQPGATIVHDGRVVWNTRRIVAASGGRAVTSQTGHALVKETMRKYDAAYGGEMSAHHYFRNFMYCDSGMIPWLLVLEHMSTTGKRLSELVADMRAAHPSSGEMNFRLPDPDNALAEVRRRYLDSASDVDDLDGLSMCFDDWRFNLRRSNTEPVLRLNLETLGCHKALTRRKSELMGLLASC